MRTLAIYVAFFLSGAAGLIYQVIWVRHFGNVFGNTVYSASLVTGVFMLGLGLGGFFAGRWIDRRRAAGVGLPLRLYGLAEGSIAILGLLLALLLPRLGPIAAWITSYRVGASGWHEISYGTHVALYALGLGLLLPITLLMGATLTLLVRHLLVEHLDEAGWRIGVLYGVNMGGAALGALLTDLLLVPMVGLLATASFGVVFNLAAAMIALRLAGPPGEGGAGATPEPAARERSPLDARTAWTAVTLLLTGFGAMGIEIIWFRFFNITFGAYREVFSILLAVMLVSMWAGSVCGGALHRRLGGAARIFMLSQAGVVITATLLLMSSEPGGALRYFNESLRADFIASGPLLRDLMAAWWRIRMIGLVIALPAFLMGFTFPVANALVQDAEDRIGRRAGVLYLANTIGAVAGSFVTGFVLIPFLGTQGSALLLFVASATAILTIYLAARSSAARSGRLELAVAGAALTVAAVGIGAWIGLDRGGLLAAHANVNRLAGERVLSTSEGVYELISVTEDESGHRRLNTNGHSMSATTIHGRRYMRLFSHFPLLHLDQPKRALVICFGVGSTARAAAMHPIERLDIVDLSRHVLKHAPYFEKWNHGVLQDERVEVFVQDGRTHLRTQPPGTYDLVTLEPPPIAFAGVSSLYTREFYELAKSKLREGGFVTQWLPAYQVPEETNLALVAAFVEVFENAILIQGDTRELILVGRLGQPVEIDLDALEERLRQRPVVKEDLAEVRVASLTDFIGLFVAGRATLLRATEGVEPMSDDRPVMEFSQSTHVQESTIPLEILAPWEAGQWCPACLSPEGSDPRLPGLPLYLGIMMGIYHSPDYREIRSWEGDSRAIEFLLPDGVTPQHPVIQSSPWLRHFFESEPPGRPGGAPPGEPGDAG
ncbi:MAG: hypothetical protein P1V51_07230 [Deltaproteobacteria bacterium]|nr:hypothetical protein [Deltaproteobacteria bacterium]